MYDFWVYGERFYTMILPILAVIALITLTGMIFVFYYTDKGNKNRKIGLATILVLMIGILGYSYFQHTKYGSWITQAKVINPGIRDRTVIFGSDIMEDPELVKSYRGMNLLEDFEKLDMYERQEISQEIGNRYLGSTGNNHYFAIGDKYAFRYTGEVEFTEGPSRLAGASFRLVDPKFEELGFTSQSTNYLETFYINREEADKASNKFPDTIIHPSEVFPEWNLGFQSTSGTSSEQ